MTDLDGFDPKNIALGIPLLPFTNQVGGHASIFRFSKKAICKPASIKEREFYEYLESHRPAILPFISQYLGVLNVTYHHSDKTHVLLPEVLFDQNEQLLRDWKAVITNKSVYPKEMEDEEEDDQQWSNIDHYSLKFNNFRRRVLCEIFNIQALKERMQAVKVWQYNQSNTQRRNTPPTETLANTLANTNATEDSIMDIHTSFSPPPSPLQDDDARARWQPRQQPTNPWGQQVYERDVQKMMQADQDHLTRQFILLEDLTDDIKYPCVLDLKMGTRQHGVYASKAKMLKQTEKCAKSTSRELGVRICGMQVYKVKERKFVFQDKYHGRRLNPNSFQETLIAYLDNGTLQLHHIPVLIAKLKKLAQLIQSMHGYRFYASSLLIIYDGEPNHKKINLRMIDFANSISPDEQRSTFKYPPHDEGPDMGYLLGLQTLIHSFQVIYEDHIGLTANTITTNTTTTFEKDT
ncbi:SAICAR synthase-like protein [Backusella circina FSU 941]|nr:SAICAR synthase-like protein [Backusella circina FSU 941]